MKRLEGKRAVVVGAASGIGRACAQSLAAAGCRTAVCDISLPESRRTVEEIMAEGGQAEAYEVNLASVESIYAMMSAVAADFGGIDILVNTAGVVQSKEFLEVCEEDWDRIIDINQKGAAFCMQAAAKEMIKHVPAGEAGRPQTGRCFGKIVTFSSISGRAGRPLQIHYAASKAAVISLTQSVALALAPYSINVNAVSPSVVDTPMWRKNVEDKRKSLGDKAQAEIDGLINRIPLKRLGSTDEMADAVLFLCSDDSNYITGQTLNVDGGFEMN